MANTFEISLIGILIVALVGVIFWYFSAEKFSEVNSKVSTGRGLNIDPGPGKSTAMVKLTCGDDDHKICVYRANVICTGNDGKNNFENRSAPFADGSPSQGSYGNFNKLSTLDITKDLGKIVNGKKESDYDFNPLSDYSNFKCDLSGNGRAQLIANYSCIPKDETCKSYLD